MSRNLLAVTDLELFTHYLDSRGIPYREGRGHYEVLQVQHRSGQWHCVFRRDRTTAGGELQHYTTDRRMEQLVRNFINWKHTCSTHDASTPLSGT